jgi:hypothetical protein
LLCHDLPAGRVAAQQQQQTIEVDNSHEILHLNYKQIRIGIFCVAANILGPAGLA